MSKNIPLQSTLDINLMNGRIKQIATAKGTTLQKVAKEVGISYSQLSNINTGNSQTSIENLKKIASVLDVSFLEFINLPEGYTYLTNDEKEVIGIVDASKLK